MQENEEKLQSLLRAARAMNHAAHAIYDALTNYAITMQVYDAAVKAMDEGHEEEA